VSLLRQRELQQQLQRRDERMVYLEGVNAELLEAIKDAAELLMLAGQQLEKMHGEAVAIYRAKLETKEGARI
jgi:hypothetical protein